MSSKIRQTIYMGGTLVSTLIGIALIWGGIDAGAADSINTIIGGLGVLLGGSAPTAVAAKKVADQRKDGTFVTVTPVEQVINGVEAVVQAQANAAADIERIKKAAAEALGRAPVVGPLTEQILSGLR